MDSGTLALWLVGVLWCFFVLWVLASARTMESTIKTLTSLRGKHNLLGEDHEATQSHVKSLFAMGEALEDGFRENRDKLDKLEKRIAGVEALLVSTVGQETQSFCRAMDEIVDRMEAPEPAPALTLSAEHVGRFGKAKEARAVREERHAK